MAEDKKKSALMLAVMLGKKPKDGAAADEAPEDGGDEMDLNSEGLHSAMKDFLIAVHKSDPEAMAEAFKDAASLCGGDDEEAEDKGDAGDDSGEGPKLDYRR